MPAAREINACCPTSLTLPKQPEDSADGFNGLLLSMFITVQICRINNHFLKNSDDAAIRPSPPIHAFERRENYTRTVYTHYDRVCRAWLAGGPLFPVLMSSGSVTSIQRMQRSFFFSQRLPLFSLSLFS